MLQADLGLCTHVVMNSSTHFRYSHVLSTHSVCLFTRVHYKSTQSTSEYIFEISQKIIFHKVRHFTTIEIIVTCFHYS